MVWAEAVRGVDGADVEVVRWGAEVEADEGDVLVGFCPVVLGVEADNFDDFCPVWGMALEVGLGRSK